MGRLSLTRRTVLAGSGAAAVTAGMARLAPARAQNLTLKVGVILPRSGVQAAIGQSCQRGAEIAPALLKAMGYKVALELMNADSESKVDVARSRAERLIGEGANVIVGAFDSGATLAIAQVTEQHGVPLVVNIAAAPQITRQGYKTVFRIFPTAGELITNGLGGFKALFQATGHTPKTAAYLHINDTFGQANTNAIHKIFPTMDMPFKIVEEISYDPAARDLSVEVAKAKASGAELAMVVTRLNDAILIIREMVRQRWSPMGIMSPGSPGMYEEQFFKTLGKYSDYCISVVPWYNPNADLSKQVVAAFTKRFPNDSLPGNIFNVGFTFEAIMVAADAAQRAGSVAPQAMLAALRNTDIKNRVMIGGPIAFDGQGQIKGSASAVLQNRGLVPKVVLPKEAAQTAPVFPMPDWSHPG